MQEECETHVDAPHLKHKWMDAAATILNTGRDLRFIWILQGDKHYGNQSRDDNFDANIV